MTTHVPCPSCSAPLVSPPLCTACGLHLVGPAARRLWEVDHELLSLSGRRARLLTERGSLLRTLRAAAGGSPAVPAARESSPRQVQGTLLGLGALLLAVAGIVFAAVTYSSLGVVGRALILLGLTLTAAAAPLRLRSRGLPGSAEAVGGVALVLSLLDAWAVRRAGFGQSLANPTYWAAATGVLALLTGGYSLRVSLRGARLTAVVLAQLPVVLLLVRLQPSGAVAALVLTALAATDLLVSTLVAVDLVAPAAGTDPSVRTQGRRALRSVSVTALVCGALALQAAVLLSLGSLADGSRAGALGLLAVAAVLAAATTRSAAGAVRTLVSLPVVPLTAIAAYGTARLLLAGHGGPVDLLPLVALAVALAALATSRLLARPYREGPVVGALAVVLGALGSQAATLGQAVATPFAWVASPWTLTGGTTARTALGPQTAWDGSAVGVAVALGAGLAVLLVGAQLDRRSLATVPGGLLLVLAGLVLPVALGGSYPLALAVLLVLAGAAVLGAGLTVGRGAALTTGLLAAASAFATLAVAWSLADRTATLVVVPVTGLLAGAVATRRAPAATVGALLLGGTVAAVGADAGWSVDQVGAGLMAVAAAVLVASVAVRRVPLEVAAGLLAATGTGLAVGDAGWLSWTLAADGLLALALSLRADRRPVAVLGALLLSASSWVRLDLAHVGAPEPYVLPLAVVALLLGHLRRQRQPGLGSFAAYGPGLSLLLVPSLLAAFADDVPLRAVLLLPAAALVVVAGVQDRLRAPMVVGGTVLVLDALQLLAPYAAALPRWSLLALVGAVLVTLGTTYEQRRKELDLLRERYEALA